MVTNERRLSERCLQGVHAGSGGRGIASECSGYDGACSCECHKREALDAVRIEGNELHVESWAVESTTASHDREHTVTTLVDGSVFVTGFGLTFIWETDGHATGWVRRPQIVAGRGWVRP